jgi:predicted N-acetyltransferase YhbS
MEFASGFIGRQADIAALFQRTFGASEGPEEGKVIAALVTELMAAAPQDAPYVFTAQEGADLLGGIMFTRLVYDQDPRRVFLLSPVAVAPEAQLKGVGQALIRHGLEQLRADGADLVITYGDPNYYSRVGFRQISETVARAPRKLSMPQGWQLCPLSAQEVAPLKGGSRCVPAFADPGLW